MQTGGANRESASPVPAVARQVLLRQEPHVVAQGDELLEERAGVLPPAHESERTGTSPRIPSMIRTTRGGTYGGPPGPGHEDSGVEIPKQGVILDERVSFPVGLIGPPRPRRLGDVRGLEHGSLLGSRFCKVGFPESRCQDAPRHARHR